MQKNGIILTIGIVYLVIGFLMSAFFLSVMTGVFTISTLPSELADSLRIISIFFFLLFLTMFISSVGLLNVKEWGRVLILLVSALVTIFIIFSLVYAFRFLSGSYTGVSARDIEETRPLIVLGIVWNFILMSFMGWAVWYISQSKIIELFRERIVTPLQPKPAFEKQKVIIRQPAAQTKTPRGPAIAWLAEYQGSRLIKQHNLYAETASIGRSDDNDIVLSGATVSKNHAKIIYRNNRFFIHDLGAKNPVIVNGQKTLQQDLQDEDVVEIGGITLIFKQVSR